MPKGFKTGGRRKGTPNKFTGDLRQMILGALAEVGGQDYLVRRARKHPGAFLVLLGKLTPTQMAGTGDGPVEVPYSDLEVARRIAFLLARGAQALEAGPAGGLESPPPLPARKSLRDDPPPELARGAS